jgi:hypothetical protein
MFKYGTTARRRLASLTLLGATMIGIVAVGAGTGSAATPEPDAPTTLGTSMAQDGQSTGEFLWFLKVHNDTRIAAQSPKQLAVRLETMPPGADPVATGKVFYFLYDSSSDAYVVKNVDGRCLDIADGISTKLGSSVALRSCDGTQSQVWKMFYSGGRHYLQNVWSGYWATAYGPYEGAGLYLYLYSDDPAQRFDIPFYGVG